VEAPAPQAEESKEAVFPLMMSIICFFTKLRFLLFQFATIRPHSLILLHQTLSVTLYDRYFKESNSPLKEGSRLPIQLFYFSTKH
jgi:hypothetical protein